MIFQTLTGTIFLTTLGLLCSPTAYAATTVIPSNSFSSYSTFESYWAYLYPWGSDHNGSARMKGSSSDHSNIVVASNTLSLIATPTSNLSPPTSSADPHPAIHYASGAIHAKSQITVTSANGYTISGEFSASTAKGTWPAFWLTAVNGWPPEADIGEWKGTANNWYNTFNTSSVVRSDLVSWPTDLSFHSLKAVLTAESNNADVKIQFYMDNTLRATQYGQGFVGKPMWLIINLQMEGSSGSPGPTGTTTYKIRNVEVTRTGS
ncbi:endo-beta-1,3-galactanase [Crucibulum laeve]|uniref:Endo-beta-1,3-galactanase n=1 Tax=Crucibulum laeve TaxID=68775 RepID=A0A5C3M8E9_9AGAR|nr:endo-beta-1,3-galactanase [Crucibulum laeve]